MQRLSTKSNLNEDFFKSNTELYDKKRAEEEELVITNLTVIKASKRLEPDHLSKILHTYLSKRGIGTVTPDHILAQLCD